VTSENFQIQSLIQQIDEVLDQTNPRLPWVTSSDAMQQRQVLEHMRNYLRSQQQGAHESSAGHPDASGSALELWAEAAEEAGNAEINAQQVLQAVVQEMDYLRLNMLQPMRSDVEALRQQRDALTQEIRQLEQQRQQQEWSPQNLQYLNDFLQAAMAQLQENLTGQMAQLLTALNPEAANQLPLLNSAGGNPAIDPAKRLEQLRQIQAQSDQLMLRLDSQFRHIFESLQNNLQTYSDSLEEGLHRMHTMGQQGEAVFGAFATKLARLLGQDSSVHPLPAEWSNDRRLASPDPIAEPEAFTTEAPVSAHPDSQLHQLLRELQALDGSALKQADSGEPVPFEATAPAVEELAALEMEELDRVLSQIDLLLLSTDEDDWIEDMPPTDDADPSAPPSAQEPPIVEPAPAEVETAAMTESTAATEPPNSAPVEDGRDDPDALPVESADAFAQQDAIAPFDVNLFVAPVNLAEPSVQAARLDFAETAGIFAAPAGLNDREQAQEDDRDHAELEQNVVIEPDVETIALLTDLIPSASEQSVRQAEETLRSNSLSQYPGDTIGRLSQDLADTEDEDSGDDPSADVAGARFASGIYRSSWIAARQASLAAARAKSAAAAQADDQIADAELTDFATRLNQADDLLELTIEDLFAAMQPQPMDQQSEWLDYPQRATNPQTHDSEGRTATAPGFQIGSPTRQQDLIETEESLLNAFTLEGLDSLFEGIPPVDVTIDRDAESD
jgi:hypothetical protein